MATATSWPARNSDDLIHQAPNSRRICLRTRRPKPWVIHGPPISTVGASLLLAGLLCIGCDVASRKAASPSQEISASEAEANGAPKLIVLISVDTLRADHLGLYGHERFTSPTLDLFALEGAVFDDASSTAPWTLPAHASMLTGLYPRDHGVITSQQKLPDDIPTLTELLDAGGWETAAAVNANWLLKENFGVTRDFQRFLFVESRLNQQLPTTRITDQAIEWIQEPRERPLFLFMHYFDVHSDYLSLPTYEKLFVSPYEGEADGTSWQIQVASFPEEFIEMCRKEFDPEKCIFGAGDFSHRMDESVAKIDFDSEDARHLEELYDAGIRQFDTEIGRFFRFLEQEKLFESTRVILTSDHGEEFLDHGSVYHFLSTYQEMLHVPLIMRGVGIPAGLRIAAPVSIVDLLPTILSWAGLEPPTETPGFDLTPLFKGGRDGHLSRRFQYGEAAGGHQWQNLGEGLAPLHRSVRRGRYKLIHRSDRERAALFDLTDDPGEKHDVASQHPGVVRDLLAEMDRRYSGWSPGMRHEQSIELDPEEAEKLRALGYIVP